MKSKNISMMKSAGILTVAVSMSLSGCAAMNGEADSASSHGIPDGPIVLAGTAPLSGAMGAYGKPQAAAYEAAVAYVNENMEGIAGHEIELRIENDQSDPAAGVAIAQGFVEDEVNAIVFPSYSPMQDQVMPVYQRANMIVTTASPPNGEFADIEKYDRFFSHFPDFDHLYTSTPEFVGNSGVTKIGILVDALPTTEGLVDRLTADFEENGVEVVSVQEVPYASMEFTTALQEIEADGAEALFALVSVGMAQVYDTLRGINWTPELITTTHSTPWSDGFDSIGEFGEITYTDCLYGVTPGETLSPKLQDILDYAVEKIGSNYPGQLTGVLTALNSILTYKYAVEEANSVDPDQVAEEIEGFSDREYLTPENVMDFSSEEHVGFQETETCSVLPLGKQMVAYSATSTEDREPIE